VEFILTNDSTDKSTTGASIITLSQQRDFLMATDGVIQGVLVSEQQFDVKYTLTIFEDGATKDFTGTVEDITLNNDISNEANIVRGTLNLFESGL